jgi:predicted transcriptional regulator
MCKYNESTIRNNLTELRREGLISKDGKAWKLTAKGRRVAKAQLVGIPGRDGMVALH